MTINWDDPEARAGLIKRVEHLEESVRGRVMAESKTNTVVPAQPGYDVVRIKKSKDQFWFEFSPVVAWIVVLASDNAHFNMPFSYFTAPVCMDAKISDKAEIIRQPDGSFVFLFGGRFEKGEEAEALAYAVEQEKACGRIW